MPFKKSSLKGPVWTSEGRAKLSSFQHRRIETVLLMSCELYNAVLESWQDQWQWHQRTHQYDDVNPADVYDDSRIAGDRGTLYGQFSEYRRTEQRHTAPQGTVMWSDLASQIGRGVIDRFDKARSSFYSRCKAKQEGKKIKAGYPRFKSSRRWRTIEIPAPDPGMVQPPAGDAKWWKLRVKGLGVIKFVPYDPDKLFYELAAGGRVQEIRIVVRSLRTEVHLVVRTVTPDPKPPETPKEVIGVDLGILNRVALSNGFCADGVTDDRTEIVKHQKVLSKHDNTHTKAGTSKHTPGRAKKLKPLQKAHARVRVRERHSLHRLVHRIVSMCVEEGFEGVAVELLRIKNMMKNPNLADRIQQQRWAMLLRMLEIKAVRAGVKYVRVDPRHTSLECSRCKNRKPKAEMPLEVRVYECHRCGLVLDRDVNAAINVLIRGFGEHFRRTLVEGGDLSPSVWSEHTPQQGVPTGRQAEGNQLDSASSDAALPEEPQTKQYASST